MVPILDAGAGMQILECLTPEEAAVAICAAFLYAITGTRYEITD